MESIWRGPRTKRSMCNAPKGQPSIARRLTGVSHWWIGSKQSSPNGATEDFCRPFRALSFLLRDQWLTPLAMNDRCFGTNNGGVRRSKCSKIKVIYYYAFEFARRRALQRPTVGRMISPLIPRALEGAPTRRTENLNAKALGYDGS